MHLICASLLPAPDVVCNSRQSPSIILIVDVLYKAIFWYIKTEYICGKINPLVLDLHTNVSVLSNTQAKPCNPPSVYMHASFAHI